VRGAVLRGGRPLLPEPLRSGRSREPAPLRTPGRSLAELSGILRVSGGDGAGGGTKGDLAAAVQLGCRAVFMAEPAWTYSGYAALQVDRDCCPAAGRSRAWRSRVL
jgi:hypothetical protein